MGPQLTAALGKAPGSAGAQGARGRGCRGPDPGGGTGPGPGGDRSRLGGSPLSFAQRCQVPGFIAKISGRLRARLGDGGSGGVVIIS